ncbi:MAG: TetR/AcrR family transcriptional regulator [Candidatus Marinimicrobia bacterium]|nr:TetR/AcrR family transcriptional regulator [Candidatus Neomarinimicrobiota bacterium]MBL7109393.1 TetR/AcrR family transcriptional regulator [Candidatus Neomarinimicrobiota bacterium]
MRKELILKSAINVFKSKGLDGATMDEIAQNAGFGKATLYYYFKSKEEIFNSILLHGWNVIWESIEDDIVGDESPRRKFIKIIKNITELVNNDRPLYEFLFYAPQTLDKQTGTEPAWKEYQQKLYNTLLHLIQTGIEKKQFPQMEPRIVLKALGGVFHGMVFWGKDSGDITEEQIEEMLDNLLGRNKSE